MPCIKAAFDKIKGILNEVLGEEFAVDENLLRPGPKPKFTDLDVIALSITQECIKVDSENWLFAAIKADYAKAFPNIISRRQYNDRRKAMFNLIELARERMAGCLNELNKIYAVDSMPLEICKPARKERKFMGKGEEHTRPNEGLCVAQGNKWYYGYKLHATCSPSGVIQTLNLTQASIADVHYLEKLNGVLSDCILIGDKGYTGKKQKAELWEKSRISLEVQPRKGQKDQTKMLYALKVARKRIETVFSQLCDQFQIQHNYAKTFTGYRTRILSKIAGMTTLHYINKFINHTPVGKIKHTLYFTRPIAAAV